MNDEFDTALDNNEKTYKERPNKTQLKRERKVIHDLAIDIISLPEEEIRKFKLEELTITALIDAKKMRKGALQRQLRYITGLLDKEEHAHIQHEMTARKLEQQRQVRQFHELETLRDQLIAGDNVAMDELYTQYPELDGQHVRQLVRNANKEAQQNKPPKSSRALFQYLKSLND